MVKASSISSPNVDSVPLRFERRVLISRSDMAVSMPSMASVVFMDMFDAVVAPPCDPVVKFWLSLRLSLFGCQVVPSTSLF